MPSQVTADYSIDIDQADIDELMGRYVYGDRWRVAKLPLPFADLGARCLDHEALFEALRLQSRKGSHCFVFSNVVNHFPPLPPAFLCDLLWP